MRYTILEESMRNKSQKGFTLIELLVVVAIIGLLASIVISALNSARQKGRDARRVSDMRVIQTAVEMFNDAANQYPTTATSTFGSISMTSYISSYPSDPVNSGVYRYYYAGLGGTSCTSYHAGATLEVANSPSLNSAVRSAVGTTCSGTSQSPAASGADFPGVGYKDCASTAGSPDQCYDVKVQ